MKDPAVRAFIEKCIADVSERMPAKELLMDPFLQADEDNESIGRSLRPQTHHSGKFHYFLQKLKFLTLCPHILICQTQKPVVSLIVVKVLRIHLLRQVEISLFKVTGKMSIQYF